MDQDKSKKNVVVETYAEDMARVIGDDTEGLVKRPVKCELLILMGIKSFSEGRCFVTTLK